MKRTLVLAALMILAAPLVNALERVAATPYTGSGNDLKTQLKLPTCTAGQVLTSLGSDTFTCINANATFQTNLTGGDAPAGPGGGTGANGGNGLNGIANSTNGGIGLPNCGTNQALAASGGKFVCANVVKSAPNCAKGYALVGNDAQTLSCVQVDDLSP